MSYFAGQNKKNAVIAFQNKDYQKAEDFLKKAITYRPDNDFNYFELARLYQVRENKIFSPAVVIYYQRAIMLNPHYAFYYYELAKYYQKFNLTEKANYFFKKFQSLYPTYKRVNREL